MPQLDRTRPTKGHHRRFAADEILGLEVVRSARAGQGYRP